MPIWFYTMATVETHIRRVPFSDIDLKDSFFDTLRGDYEGFDAWFNRKANEGQSAYVQYSSNNKLQAFLYTKEENGVVEDVIPQLHDAKRLKVGTFKIDAHHTKLGEYFIRLIVNEAIAIKAKEIYLTVFPKWEQLVSLIEEYGFTYHGKKGGEDVYLKSMTALRNDPVKDFPMIQTVGRSKYLLAIYPIFHTPLFPDSILCNERKQGSTLIQDVSYTNSIHKVYVCKIPQAMELKRNDIITIYRTSDHQGPAALRSVITSLCIVEEVRGYANFASIHEYKSYANTYSVFDEETLSKFYNPNLVVIKMTYNAPLHKRITRQTLIEEVGLPEGERWSLLSLTDKQFNDFISLGGVDEGIVIH